MTIFGKKKSKILPYLYEFIVLFLSIYIAFQLEEWDEAGDFTDREVAYLASLHQDLTKDINQLNRRIVEYDEKINSTHRVLEMLEGSYDLNKTAIANEFQSHLISHFNYNLNNSTLETLKNSGDLKLIKNHEFKILLSELGKSYTSTEHQWEKFNDYTEGLEWTGFFINHFDIGTFVALDHNPNFAILLQNRLRHFVFLIERYFFQLQGTLKKTEEVKSSLEDEMTKRSLYFGEEKPDDESNLENLNDELDDFLDGIGGDEQEDESKKEDKSETESNEEDSDNIDEKTDDLLDELDDLDF